MKLKSLKFCSGAANSVYILYRYFYTFDVLIVGARKSYGPSVFQPNPV